MDETEGPQPENKIWPPPVLDSNEPISEPDLSKEIVFGRLSLVSPYTIVISIFGSFILSLMFSMDTTPWANAVNYSLAVLDKHAKLIAALLELSGLIFGFLGRKSSVGKFGLMMNLILLPFVALIEI